MKIEKFLADAVFLFSILSVITLVSVMITTAHEIQTSDHPEAVAIETTGAIVTSCYVGFVCSIVYLWIRALILTVLRMKNGVGSGLGFRFFVLFVGSVFAAYIFYFVDRFRSRDV